MFRGKYLIIFVLLFHSLSASAVLPQAQTAQPDTLAPVYYYFRDTFCSDQLVLINNGLYSPQNPTGTEIIKGGAKNGADSIIVVSLLFRKPVRVDLHQPLCENDTLWVNGSPYHVNHWFGEEIIQNGAANGCDSIIDIKLTVGADPYFYLRDTLCPDSFLLVNGHRYDRQNRSGFEILKGESFTGCDSLVFVELSFWTTWVYLGADREVVLGETVCLNPQFSNHPSSLSWAPAPPPVCQNPDCPYGCIQPFESTEYQLTVIDTNGCPVADTIHFFLSRNNRVYAPNIFSPESDKFENRYFYLSADTGVKLVNHLRIADRYGSIVYDTDSLYPNIAEKGWNGYTGGKIAPEGVYVFWAELERIDGTRFEKSGSFVLTR